jgi:hypothetical protein
LLRAVLSKRNLFVKVRPAAVVAMRIFDDNPVAVGRCRLRAAGFAGKDYNMTPDAIRSRGCRAQKNGDDGKTHR